MRRFERIYDVVEPVEEYRTGGYHPVHLHDVFVNRYEVIGKLAFGQFSTVWLASDRKWVLHCTGLALSCIDHICRFRLHQPVALKILKSSASGDNEELPILRRLSNPTVDHPGKNHIVQLFNHFYHYGPNGKHLCLVFPVMLSDGESMTVTGRLREMKFIQNISMQLLLGLDFLHRQGIIHCGRLILLCDLRTELICPSTCNLRTSCFQLMMVLQPITSCSHPNSVPSGGSRE